MMPERMTPTPEQVSAAREWFADWLPEAAATEYDITSLAALLAAREAAARMDGFNEAKERATVVLLDEVDGADEERARDSMLSRLAAAIRALRPKEKP